MLHSPIYEDSPPLHPIDTQERDACALICAVRKGGEATHGNVKRSIEGLARMGHRTGYIDGEGDGVGILTDIPRQLWMKRLARAGLRSSLAANRNFWIAHLMIPAIQRNRAPELVEYITNRIVDAGLTVLLDRPGKVNREVLGPNAEKNEPVFYQIAGINDVLPYEKLENTLFNLRVGLERDLGVHFASFSAHSVVYKVQGTVEILRRYYPELRDPDYASAVTLGHARYSTNTNPVFERAQPFGVLGHNGEFNTISRFRMEAAMLGVYLDPNNSDSQDVDRLINTLCLEFGLDLIEAMELVFPPYKHDLLQSTPEIHTLYENMRQSFGPFAQGPAAVAARFGDLCVFSVDALGLRPLWFGETEKEYFAASERGVYPLDSLSSDPKPMAPGEKIALRIHTGHSIEVLDHAAIQRHVLNRARQRGFRAHDAPGGIWSLGDLTSSSDHNAHPANGNGSGYPVYSSVGSTYEPAATAVAERTTPTPVKLAVADHRPMPWQTRETKITAATMAALGWERYHLNVIEAVAEAGKELVGSLGWDGPLAALSHTRVNLADYFKETVAVVTNPAIDRERERAQFSTQVLIGARPMVGESANPDDLLIKLETPLLLGGHTSLGKLEDMRVVAHNYGTMTLEDLVDYCRDRAVFLSTATLPGEALNEAVERLCRDAVTAVQQGAQCLILDDTDVFSGEGLMIDPLMATAAVDHALRHSEQPGVSLRRRTGLVLRSGALRDLHDLALALGMGANALLPYALYAVALDIAPRGSKELPASETVISRLGKAVNGLVDGLQKVTSTIGCHELRGYGHSFGSVGLSSGVAKIFGTPNYFGSSARGLTWERLQADAEQRAAEMRGEIKNRLENPDRLYPKMWKKIEDIAAGELSLADYTEAMLELEEKQPVEVRHVLGLKTEGRQPVDAAQVDLNIKDHSLPVYIGAMSFGSQGELAYTAYAEAGYRLNIITVNGEGGELPHLLGKYPRNRGQQVASGRFGVNAAFLNSCNLIEIKIGQGAKPGEGGQLPGSKVTEQVAAARNTVPGVGLISPSNNHDIYSIEDLAQIIDELKTINPHARVSVKIPVVPGVGIIAVGIAKAGADIIALAGYTGGTGAARAHSLRHVGLPTEIGVYMAHRALVESGLRDNVELWCDGGMKSGRDVVKMMCMGANRVGFGTLAMVAVGCTICRKCHDGTCHVGITTHIRTKEEATLKGLKSFEPRDYDLAVQSICNVFHILEEDMRIWVGKLGYTRAQELVGHAELLEQIAMHENIDLTALLTPAPAKKKKVMPPGGRRLTRPRNTLSKQITAIVSEQVARGEMEMTYDDEQVMAMDRALGTHVTGALKRREFANAELVEAVHLSFSNSAVPGNGLAAFLDDPVQVLVEGGAQDGVAKCSKGGSLSILKGLNHNGQRVDGSVGKCFAYGAQGGFFIVQGNADTRACIRLSGASVIFGGEVTQPLNDDLGALATRANLKGYACEYMTSGRVLIMGDPGPWMCAGMTGGVIYQRIQMEMGLTVDAIRRRIAEGATVQISSLDEKGAADVRELLHTYIHTLESNNQWDSVQHLYALLVAPQDHFIKIAPGRM